MKAARYFQTTALGAALVSVAFACSETPEGEVSEDTDAGSTGTIPEVDATPSDGGGDADAAVGDTGDAGDAEPARTCTDEGWCHTAVPDAQTLRDVWGDGQGTVWTVSEQGNILRWDGKAWVQSHAAGVPLYAIWGSGPTDLWAGGGLKTAFNVYPPGVLLHGTGASPSTITWKQVETPTVVRSIWGSGPSDIFVVASVTHRVNVADPNMLLHVDGTAPDEEGRPVWTIDPVTGMFPAHFEKVWGTSADDVWLGGRTVINPSNRGQVLHRKPDGAGGFTWAKDQPTTTSAAGADIYGTALSPGMTCLVGFVTNTYHAGIDDAGTATWTQYTAASTGFTNSALGLLWGTGANDIWVAGQRGRIRHWDGTSWRVAAVSVDDDLPMQKPVWGVWSGGPNDTWVVGADVALHKVAP